MAPPLPLTFLPSPTTALTWFPPATRYLTASLRHDPGLQVEESAAPVEIFVDSFRAHRRLVRGRPAESTLEAYSRQPMLLCPHLDVAAGRYDRKIVEAAPAETVLLSALTVFDLYVARVLLNAGKRVALGGNLTTLYSTARLRSLLAGLGCDAGRLERDLVVLSGLVTPATRLSPLLEAWKDAPIPLADPASMFGPVEDVLLPHAPLVQAISGRSMIALPLSTGCWWGACEFCTVRNQPSVDLAAGVEPSHVVAHLHALAAAYDCRDLVLTDNYLRLTDPVKAVLRARGDLKVTVYSGVRLLADPEFVEALDPLVDGLRIGVESGSDFALGQARKGFTFAETERAIQNLAERFDPAKKLSLLIVFDLPHESVDDVRRGYERLCALKTRLADAGFRRVSVSGFPLLAFPDTAMLSSSPQLEEAPPSQIPDEELCGASVLSRWWERAHGVALPTSLATLMAAYRRRDRSGAAMPSDLRIIEPATLAFLEGRGGSDVQTS